MSEELRIVMSESLDRVGETSRANGFAEAILAAGKIAMAAEEYDLANRIFSLKPAPLVITEKHAPASASAIPPGWTKWDGKEAPIMYSMPGDVKLLRADGTVEQMVAGFDWMTDGKGVNPVVAYDDEIPF